MDDGGLLGLERDYTSLAGDRDKFERHLRNLLQQKMGVSFAANKLRVQFPVVADREICQIEIAPASRELPLSEMQDYIKERFS
jgi:hypothetical protein